MYQLLFKQGYFSLWSDGEVYLSKYPKDMSPYKPRQSTARLIHNMNDGPIEQAFPSLGTKNRDARINDLETIASVWSHYITHGHIGDR